MRMIHLLLLFLVPIPATDFSKYTAIDDALRDDLVQMRKSRFSNSGYKPGNVAVFQGIA